jgi:hypothetical protein
MVTSGGLGVRSLLLLLHRDVDDVLDVYRGLRLTKRCPYLSCCPAQNRHRYRWRRQFQHDRYGAPDS